MRKAESAPLFQFHKGSIKTGYIGDELVQYDKFQFHKGSIKTNGRKYFEKVLTKFQFHKGSIKTYLSRGCCRDWGVSIPQRFD